MISAIMLLIGWALGWICGCAAFASEPRRSYWFRKRPTREMEALEIVADNCLKSLRDGYNRNAYSDYMRALDALEERRKTEAAWASDPAM